MMESNPTPLQKVQTDYNPPTYFWIAYYRNGQALPQYDPETCNENLFKNIDQTNLTKFGWYPFSPEFAGRIKQKKDYDVKCRFLPSYEMFLGKGQRLIAVQRQSIKMGNLRKTVYLLGWQNTIEGKNVKSIMFIHEDGSVKLGEDYNMVS